MRAARLAVALLLAAVAAALAASLLTLLLHAVAHVVVHGGESYARIGPWRRVLTAPAGAVVAALGWWWLRRHGPVTSLASVQRDPSSRMSSWRNTVDAVITVLAVGSGMAVGRETAPRQVAAALTDHVTWRLRLPDRDRVLVMAAASAAGLAAVYNAPLAGVAYACEVVLRRWSWRGALLAVLPCALGTALAWPVVGRHPNLGFPPGVTAAWWWGAPLGVLAAALGVGYRRVTEWGRDAEAPRGPRLVGSVAAVGLALGLTTLALPDVTGNGRAAIGAVLHDGPSVLVVVGLLVAKPLLTTGFLRAGAVGGVLAPALAAGACSGALVGHATGAAPAALAVATAGATLSVTQRAAFFGPLLAWEMTRPGCEVSLALALATVVAQLLVRVGAAAGARLSRAGAGPRRRPSASGSSPAPRR